MEKSLNLLPSSSLTTSLSSSGTFLSAESDFDSSSGKKMLIVPPVDSRNTSCDADEGVSGFHLSWNNVTVELKRKPGGVPNSLKSLLCCERSGDLEKPASILNNVSGYVGPGSLLAILGPNAAGRTTLLNVLAQRTAPDLRVHGEVMLNGSVKLARNIRNVSAYIEEHDVFNGNLTVAEHLNFQAALRVPGPRENRGEKVQDVMCRLGLVECANTFIGTPGVIKGISGGEKKRLSFASELLTEPSILFADEPTTGLDSYMAENVIRKLKEMASEGKTVICTVRTVSSEVYALFDRIMLMSVGRVAYAGSMEDAVSHFEEMEYRCPAAYNPADYFMSLLTVQDGPSHRYDLKRVHAMCDLLERSLDKSQVDSQRRDKVFADMSTAKIFDASRSSRSVSPPPGVYGLNMRPSWQAQFLCLLWRSWLTNSRDAGIYRLRILTTVILALVCGLCMFQVTGGWKDIRQVQVINVSGAVYMFMFMSWDNAFVMVSSFTRELDIFRREHGNGLYGYTVYFAARVLSSVPHYSFIATVWTFILYWFFGLQPSTAPFLTCYLTVCLLIGIASGYGAVLATWFNGNMTLTFQVGPNPLVISFLVGGKFVNVASLPPYLYWMQYLSWHRYAYEILLVSQWSPVQEIACDTDRTHECFRDGQSVIDSYSFGRDTTIPVDLLALGVMLFLYYLLSYAAMAIRCRLGNKMR